MPCEGGGGEGGKPARGVSEEGGASLHCPDGLTAHSGPQCSRGWQIPGRRSLLSEVGLYYVGGLMILGNMSGLSRYKGIDNTTGIVLCRPVQITLLPNLPLFHTKRS